MGIYGFEMGQIQDNSSHFKFPAPWKLTYVIQYLYNQSDALLLYTYTLTTQKFTLKYKFIKQTSNE